MDFPGRMHERAGTEEHTEALSSVPSSASSVVRSSAQHAAGPVRVLVVEDHPMYARVVQRWLEDVPDPMGCRYIVSTAETMESACVALERGNFDAVVLDLILPDCKPEQSVASIRAKCEAPIIVLSSLREGQIAMEALRHGAQDYLMKDQVDADRLQRSIRYAIERAALEHELRRQNQALRALSECTQIAATAESEAELYADVCKMIVHRGGYRFAWIGMVKNSKPPRIEPTAWYGFAPSYLDRIEITLDDAPTGRGPAARAVCSGRSQTVADIFTDADFAPWRERAARHGYRSLIALPILLQGRAIAALCVYSDRRNAFGPTATELLEKLVANVALGIERLRAGAERDHAEQERRQAEWRFRFLAEMFPVGVVCGDTNGCCVYVNDRACHIVGRKREELLGDGWKRFVHEEDRLRLIREWEVWKTAPVMEVEFRCLRPNGSLVWVNLQLAPAQRENGQQLFVATLTDVTARRRAEEALEQITRNLEQMVIERTRQLESALHELEAFNHSLAHDIRAPLRRVVAYCELLKLRCAPALPEQAKQYIDSIRGNAARLDRLVEDLLNLARVRTYPLRCQEVNLSLLCERILRSLQEAHPERHVEQVIAQGVCVWADPNLIEVALANLLENAWKYTSGKTPAWIHFGVEYRDGMPVYYVKDNGCGFENSLAEELFKPFTRLPGSEGFDGTGIGLATVRRILGRHGGRVWAVSCPGEGATFYFTLPPRPDATAHSLGNMACNS